MKPRTNRWAIASFVWAIVWMAGIGSLLSLWCGIRALRQINAAPDVHSGVWLARVGIGLASLELLAIAVVLAIATTS